MFINKPLMFSQKGRHCILQLTYPITVMNPSYIQDPIQNIRKLEKTGNIPKSLCNQLSWPPLIGKQENLTKSSRFKRSLLDSKCFRECQMRIKQIMWQTGIGQVVSWCISVYPALDQSVHIRHLFLLGAQCWQIFTKSQNVQFSLKNTKIQKHIFYQSNIIFNQF